MKKFVLYLFILMVGFAPASANALLKIDITRGNIDPMPIAITPFKVASGDEGMAEDIAGVLTADLERSGLFKAIDERAFIEKISGADAMPRFADWRRINAQALVTTTYKESGGKITVEFRLWDILSQKQFAGKSFSASEGSWRRVAHLVADEIYKRLTGEDGYFDSRVVYVSESGSKKRPEKRLAIMDQDGANHRFLTDGNTLVLTPRFHPSSQKVIYLAYYNRMPRVYVLDLETGREKVLGDFNGMTFAPRFSPDGRKAIMSASLSGNSEVFEVDLGSGKSRRITNHPSIDTSPSFSPDGRRIVFNSDRGGSQQIYTMSADGGNVKRISFGKGTYGSPIWSPRGDLIAFTKMLGPNFHIGVMRADGSGERILTTSYLDDSPTWSPNGRVIMFARSSPEGGSTTIYSIDLTGYNEQRLDTPEDASDPAWGPLLK